MNFILQVDENLSNYLSGLIPHTNFFDQIFAFFSLIGGSWLWWSILIILLIVYEEHRNHRFLIYFAGSFGLTFFINNFILKHIFLRHRPITSYNCPTDYSFPSTHAATAFASATILASFDPKRKYIYYIGALIVSFSRIYLSCHYMGDVVIGGLIGALISTIALKIPLSYNKKRPSVHKK